MYHRHYQHHNCAGCRCGERPRRSGVLRSATLDRLTADALQEQKIMCARSVLEIDSELESLVRQGTWLVSETELYAATEESPGSLTLFLPRHTYLLYNSFLISLPGTLPRRPSIMAKAFSVVICPTPVGPTSLDRITVQKRSAQSQAAAVSAPPLLLSSPYRLAFSPHRKIRKPPSLHPSREPCRKGFGSGCGACHISIPVPVMSTLGGRSRLLQTIPYCTSCSQAST